MTVELDLNDSQTIKIIETLIKNYPQELQFKSKHVGDIAKSLGLSHYSGWKFANKFPKVGRGLHDLSSVINAYNGVTSTENTADENTVDEKVVDFPAPKSNKISDGIKSMISDDVYIPSIIDTYVSWGHFNDIKKIVKSKQFFPVYISGLSGNGKTMMVEQVCASLKREIVRVQISPETSEDDLLGGFRLIDGETVFAKGPVIKAMESGAILLLDEIDRGTNKIMCLQGVMEGKPVLIKKTGEVISPAPGFNVIATANTKGRGSEDGRFASTIIDDAFLERFTITIEQPYPSSVTENKIIINHMNKFGNVDKVFAKLLIDWSTTIRKTYEEEGVDELISTRRLCHITQTFSIFNDRLKSVELCIARFDDEVREAFLDLYTKIDADSSKSDDDNNNDLPF